MQKVKGVEEKTKTKTKQGMLLVTIVALFVAAALTFPYAFNVTWALGGSSTDRTLTYTPGKLTWDSAAQINEDGSIKLSLFKTSYGNNVVSSDNTNVVAPGTQNYEGIRLLNSAGKEIKYTAVLYRQDKNEAIIDASLSGGTKTQNYTLPTGVAQDDVVSAISGGLSGSSAQTLGVNWEWKYSNKSVENADANDTTATNNLENEYVNYALYIVAEDTNTYPKDDDSNKNNNNKNKASGKDSSSNKQKASSTSTKKVLPRAGDNSKMILLFALSAAALLVAIVIAFGGKRKRRESKSEQTDGLQT